MWPHLKTSVTVMLGAVPLGLLIALLGSALFADLTYGVDRRDALSLSLAVVVAIVTGLVGTWVPVRRAANANVVKVLRES
jgi:ABC-type antimicrobial peptide transport system permease subunit